VRHCDSIDARNPVVGEKAGGLRGGTVLDSSDDRGNLVGDLEQHALSALASDANRLPSTLTVKL
jgi:hypothetical protein